MENNWHQEKRISWNKAIALIAAVVLITAIFVYGFYAINYCSDGDDFSQSQTNELWGIISNFDLMKSPNYDDASNFKENFLIAHVDTIAQVAIIETNQEWKKIAVLKNLNASAIGWVDAKKIKCARNLTKWMQENLRKADSDSEE